MLSAIAHALAIPFAALMRIVRTSAQLHPGVYSFTPHDEPSSYQVNRPY